MNPTPRRRPTEHPPGGAKAHTFICTAEVNAAAARVRLAEIAEEVIGQLTSDSMATVKVTIEISADFPDGVSEQIKRVVSENVATLGAKTRPGSS